MHARRRRNIRCVRRTGSRFEISQGQPLLDSCGALPAAYRSVCVLPLSVHLLHGRTNVVRPSYRCLTFSVNRCRKVLLQGKRSSQINAENEL